MCGRLPVSTRATAAVLSVACGYYIGLLSNETERIAMAATIHTDAETEADDGHLLAYINGRWPPHVSISPSCNSSTERFAQLCLLPLGCQHCEENEATAREKFWEAAGKTLRQKP